MTKTNFLSVSLPDVLPRVGGKEGILSTESAGLCALFLDGGRSIKTVSDEACVDFEYGMCLNACGEEGGSVSSVCVSSFLVFRNLAKKPLCSFALIGVSPLYLVLSTPGGRELSVALRRLVSSGGGLLNPLSTSRLLGIRPALPLLGPGERLLP